MVRMQFKVGELVAVDSGYASGVWLRGVRTPGKNQSGDWILASDVAIVLEIIDDDVKVISSIGVIGWTRRSRLRHLQDD